MDFEEYAETDKQGENKPEVIDTSAPAQIAVAA